MIKLDKTPTDCIIRRWKSGYSKGELIALFPGVLASCQQAEIESYIQVGQHSAANYWTVLTQTKIVKNKEEKGVKSLLKELRSFGYRIRMIRKMTEQHRRLVDEQLRQVREY